MLIFFKQKNKHTQNNIYKICLNQRNYYIVIIFNNLTYLGNIQFLKLHIVISHKQHNIDIITLYLLYLIGTCFDGQDVYHYLVVEFS